MWNWNLDNLIVERFHLAYTCYLDYSWPYLDFPSKYQFVCISGWNLIIISLCERPKKKSTLNAIFTNLFRAMWFEVLLIIIGFELTVKIAFNQVNQDLD